MRKIRINGKNEESGVITIYSISTDLCTPTNYCVYELHNCYEDFDPVKGKEYIISTLNEFKEEINYILEKNNLELDDYDKEMLDSCQINYVCNRVLSADEIRDFIKSKKLFFDNTYNIKDICKEEWYFLLDIDPEFYYLDDEDDEEDEED